MLTREVKVGAVAIGGNNPVRIQSMTTTATSDVEATVAQIVRLADSGCEIVRVTVQGMKEARACQKIKQQLIEKGLQIPLVADIHFYPPAALFVADFVDKVRINPGNFADKRATLSGIQYDEASFNRGFENIVQKFSPLVIKCKALRKPIRIGTNHGSLSDRIMARYGDSPMGMVESALEYAKVCADLGFHDLIFSMKSSNPKVMIAAYRLLTKRLQELGLNYPLHLGVTEAGDGLEGRIKSTVGIASLLIDGIGDTIRVSLTEDPWEEIDPCQKIVEVVRGSYCCLKKIKIGLQPNWQFKHEQLANLSSQAIFLSCDKEAIERENISQDLGLTLNGKKKVDFVDAIVLQESIDPSAFDKLNDSYLKKGGVALTEAEILTLKEASTKYSKNLFTSFREAAVMPIMVRVEDGDEKLWSCLNQLRPAIIFLAPASDRVKFCRKFFNWFNGQKNSAKIIINFSYDLKFDSLLYHASAELGSILCDELGDGIWIEGNCSFSELKALSFGIMQACRLRISKPDYISCPSCGRTLFDLQQVTRRIKDKTAHLVGVKIAIMGCIVNGPGEMADADFGYVGSAAGKIDLYLGKKCVEKNIDFEQADRRLIDLIKSQGKWHEPQAETNVTF